jgi:protein-S-isoprenylcysteine O-methyltransferase Ste14
MAVSLECEFMRDLALASVQLWNVIFLCGLIVYVSIRGFYKARAESNRAVLRQTGAVEYALQAILLPGVLVLPLVYLFTPWLGFADYRLPGFVPLVGTVLMVAALWLFWRSHADLGQNWSQTLEVRDGHQLITAGVYRFVRHPMYGSIWLWCLAQGLMLANWLAGWYAVVAFALMYFVRTPREERMMREFFGQPYLDYMGRTGRIFPRPRGRRT